jgi:hypothetical protein
MNKRKHVGWLAGAIAIFSAPLWAADAPMTSTQGGPSAKTPDPALSRLLDQYATIAGAWFLEQRCNTLSPDLKREFDWNVAQTNMALSLKVKPDFLQGLQPPAKKVADKYDCDDKARSLVAQVLALSQATTVELTGKRYSLMAEAQYQGQRIVSLLVAKAVDDRCHVMAPDARAAYDGRVQEITDRFSATAGARALDELRAKAGGVDSSKFNCARDGRTFAQSAIVEAQAMLGK